MATNYPKGIDNFNEPSAPDITPLSSSGSGTRNHVEHHRDLGDAIEALQLHASPLDHDHSGVQDASGRISPKLKQSSTHEESDVDSSKTALHHTLGPGKYQAAPGDHIHDYSGPSIINKPIVNCLSDKRPSSPEVGQMILETDTQRVRMWGSFGGTENRWGLLPVASIPIVRLLQGKRQRINASGSLIEFHTEEEDTFGFFDASSSRTDVVVTEPGLYDLSASIAWDPSEVFGDHAYTRVMINGRPTKRVHSEFIRGNLFTPGFSQTVLVTGKVRLEEGDRLSIQGSHNGAFAQWTCSTSTGSYIDTRLDLCYIAP